MRFLFTTEHQDSVSTVINLANFERLSAIDDVSFSAFQNDYENHDVILFMGYDPKVHAARAANPTAKIGIVDIRPNGFEAASGADFLLSNGPEMTAFAARHFSNIFEYPIYPAVEPVDLCTRAEEPIVISYHGNKAHAVSMFPEVTHALEELAKTFSIKLQLIYNVTSLGAFPQNYLAREPVEVSIVNWYPDVYANELAQSDIGIVPNLTPLHHRDKAAQLTSPQDQEFGAHPSEFLTRFKATSNAGRLLTFAQFGIPVVADLFPSAAMVIRNDHNGYLAHDAFGWYQALYRLCNSSTLRRRLGQNLLRDFKQQFAVSTLNKRLVDFCRDLPPAIVAPEHLANAALLFDQLDHRPVDRSSKRKRWW